MAMRRPDIVVIMTDQQRADTLACLGPSIATTPNIDRLAARGIAFARAFAPIPICSPSRASLWTGLHAHRHGVSYNVYGQPDVVRSNGLVTVFHRLRAAGYRLAYVGKWHLGEADPGLFDQWEGYNSRAENWVETAAGERAYRSDRETDQALAILAARDPDVPLCLVVSYQPPHPPYDPPAAFSAAFAERFPDDPMLAGYFGAVLAIDRCVGRLIDGIAAAGRLDATAILYLSDHGMLHGAREGANNKRHLYDETARIPLIVAWPDGRGAGRRSTALVSLLDVAPTLLDLAGAAPLPEAHGASLPAHATDPAPPRPALLLQNVGLDRRDEATVRVHQRAVRTARAKLILASGAAPMLFDLDADPEERRNLLAPGARIARAPLADLTRALGAQAAAVGDDLGISLAQAMLARLGQGAPAAPA